MKAKNNDPCDSGSEMIGFGSVKDKNSLKKIESNTCRLFKISKVSLALGSLVLSLSCSAGVTRIYPYIPSWIPGSSNYIHSLMEAYNKRKDLQGLIFSFYYQPNELPPEIAALDKGVSGYMTDHAADVQAFIQATNGNLGVSFGGWCGNLKSYATSADSVHDALLKSVESLGFKPGQKRLVDLDMEGDDSGEYADVTSDKCGAFNGGNVSKTTVNNFVGGVQKLLKEHPEYDVGVTLEASDKGFKRDWIPGAFITAQQKEKKQISFFNLMAFNFNGSLKGIKDPATGKEMTTAVDQVKYVLNKAHAQLAKYLGEATKPESIWTMLGVTVMIGATDQSGRLGPSKGEYPFTLDDATELAKFAKSKNMALLSYWNFDRDNSMIPLADLPTGFNLSLSSGYNTAEFNFFDTFMAGQVLGSGATGQSNGSGETGGGIFAEGASGGSTTSTNCPKVVSQNTGQGSTGAGGACSAWADSVTYHAGDKVTFNQGVYVARQPHMANMASGWTPSEGTLWKRVASCSAEGATLGSCQPWLEGMEFQAGQVVSYNNKSYTCLQGHTAWQRTGWTPEATPALWKEGGSCSGGGSSNSGGGSLPCTPAGSAVSGGQDDSFGITGGIFSGGVTGTSFSQSPTGGTTGAAESPATKGVLFFDDFSYASTADLEKNGWIIRSDKNQPYVGPGDNKSHFPSGSVTVEKNGGDSIIRLHGTVDAGTVNQAMICSQQKFLEGTYAARVLFRDKPDEGTYTPTGTGSPTILQTFYMIGNSDKPLADDYSELDFEYLVNGGWGAPSGPGPALWVTSWHTADFISKTDNGYRSISKSFDGWHTLVVQVDAAKKSTLYFVDGQPVNYDKAGSQKYSYGASQEQTPAEITVSDRPEGGSKKTVYPRTQMAINFNLWFASGASGFSTKTTFTEDVDWVFHVKGDILSPEQVEAKIKELKGKGTSFQDDVKGGKPSTCNL